MALLGVVSTGQPFAPAAEPASERGNGADASASHSGQLGAEDRRARVKLLCAGGIFRAWQGCSAVRSAVLGAQMVQRPEAKRLGVTGGPGLAGACPGGRGVVLGGSSVVVQTGDSAGTWPGPGRAGLFCHGATCDLSCSGDQPRGCDGENLAPSVVPAIASIGLECSEQRRQC